MLLPIAAAACGESARAPSLFVDGESSPGRASDGEDGADGGVTTTSRPAAPSTPQAPTGDNVEWWTDLDPNQPYIVGDLEEPGCRKVLARIHRPSFNVGAFPCSAFTDALVVLRFTTEWLTQGLIYERTLIYADGLGNIRQWVADEGFPDNPEENDPILETPACPGSVEAELVRAADGSIVYRCQPSASYYTLGTDDLVLERDMVATHLHAINGDLGVSTTSVLELPTGEAAGIVAPPGSIDAVGSYRDGFVFAVDGAAYELAPDGTTTPLGDYPEEPWGPTGRYLFNGGTQVYFRAPGRFARMDIDGSLDDLYWHTPEPIKDPALVLGQ